MAFKFSHILTLLRTDTNRLCGEQKILDSDKSFVMLFPFGCLFILVRRRRRING